MSYKNRVRKNASEGSNPSLSALEGLILEYFIQGMEKKAMEIIV